jgi:hypothetical protein
MVASMTRASIGALSAVKPRRYGRRGRSGICEPAPRLQRVLAGGPLADGCGFGPVMPWGQLPLCSPLITRRNSQGARAIRAQSCGRVDRRRRRPGRRRRFADQARNRCLIAALFACLLAAQGGEIYVVCISFESSGISR